MQTAKSFTNATNDIISKEGVMTSQRHNDVTLLSNEPVCVILTLRDFFLLCWNSDSRQSHSA